MGDDRRYARWWVKVWEVMGLCEVMREGMGSDKEGMGGDVGRYEEMRGIWYDGERVWEMMRGGYGRWWGKGMGSDGGRQVIGEGMWGDGGRHVRWWGKVCEVMGESMWGDGGRQVIGGRYGTWCGRYVRWMGKVMGVVCEMMGGMWGDGRRYWRWWGCYVW